MFSSNDSNGYTTVMCTSPPHHHTSTHDRSWQNNGRSHDMVGHMAWGHMAWGHMTWGHMTWGHMGMGHMTWSHDMIARHGHMALSHGMVTWHGTSIITFHSQLSPSRGRGDSQQAVWSRLHCPTQLLSDCPSTQPSHDTSLHILRYDPLTYPHPHTPSAMIPSHTHTLTHPQL